MARSLSRISISTVTRLVFPRDSGDVELRRRKRPQRSEAKPSFLVLFLLGLFPFLFFKLVPIPVLTKFEWTVYDAQMRLRNALDPRPLDSRIRAVGVSDADQQRLDEDLFRRQSYMELLTRLREWGAESVTFDIFFIEEREADDLFAFAIANGGPPVVLAYNFQDSEPLFHAKGASPADLADYEILARGGMDADKLEEAIRYLDDYLAELRAFEVQQRRNPSNEFTDRERRNLLDRIAWVREIRDQLQRRWFWATVGHDSKWPGTGVPYEARDVRTLSPKIMLAPESLGFANVEKGSSEVVRQVPLVFAWNERLFPNLSLATALRYFGVPFSEVEIDWGRELRFTPRQHGNGVIRIPIDHRGNYLVNFREGEAFLNRNPTLSAVILPDVEESARQLVRPGEFKDAFVFIGEVISGGGATDVEPIPIQSEFPMVGLHANVLDNILRDDFLRRAPLWLQLLLFALMALAMAAVYFRLSFAKSIALTILLVLAYVAAQFALFASHGLIFDVVTPVGGVVLAGIGFFGYLVVVKERDRRLVRDVFLKSVSPRIGQEILKKYYDDAIWGARRQITVLFIDVRGYTTLSETHPPEVMLGMLDRFYDTVSEAVFHHEGQVNKFLGDAVLALFGALPEEPGNHAERAIRAAAQVQQAMSALNESEFVERFGARIETGAGVNTGEATVGLVGRSRIRIEYTALGDAVNIAARLQTLAHESEVVISESALEQAGGGNATFIAELQLVLQEKEQLAVKGKKEPIPVWRARIATPNRHP